MNLIEVKKYFSKNPTASAVEVAAYFNVKPADINCYLKYWENRGNLVPCQKSCASGCNLCFRHNYCYYTWQEH